MNSSKQSAEGLDVLILCGGLGTRLRSVVSDRPKVLANIGKQPFLDKLLTNLSEQGFKRIILALGYMADAVTKHLQAAGWMDRADIEIVTSVEKEQLGTGGAIANAAPLIKTDHVIVINGDTLTSLDFGQAFDFHKLRNAAVTVLATPRPQGNNFGRVATNSQGHFQGYTDAPAPAGTMALVGSGSYIMRSDIVRTMPTVPHSIERDFLPTLGATCHVFETPHDFLDIGTPERYEQAQQLG